MPFNKKTIQLFWTLAVLLSVGISNAQVYPVQIYTQLQLPFSGYLPEYGGIYGDKLQVFLQLNDLQGGARRVKLKIELTGNNFSIITKPEFQPSPIILQPGIPMVLSGSDLGVYFSPVALRFTGLSQTLYNQRKVIPEGPFSLCVSVLDYDRTDPVLLSESFCQNSWFLLNDPPIPVLPLCQTGIDETQLQQIFFSWSFLNYFNQLPGVSTQYQFELFEYLPENISPVQFTSSVPPLFTTQTTQENFLLTNQVMLVTGRKYLWRVRAIHSDNRGITKNFGYSLPCQFVYGSWVNPSLLQINLSAQVQTHRLAKLLWNQVPGAQNYHLQIKKANAQIWVDLYVNGVEKNTPNLEPGTQYKARIRGNGNPEITYPYSPEISFTTHFEPVYSCNSTLTQPPIQGAAPLANAGQGMIVKVGQFEMMLIEVGMAQGPGRFSGRGKIKIPGGITIAGVFENVFIDENFELLQGCVKAETEGINSWSGSWSYNNAHFYSGNLDHVFTGNNGWVYFVNENGDTTALQLDFSGGLLITDAGGNQWVINPDGSVVPVSGGGLLPVSGQNLSEQELRILRKAIDVLALRYTGGRNDSLQTKLSNDETNLDQFIQNQKNSFQGSLLSGEPDEIIMSPLIPDDSGPGNPGTQVHRNYKESERLFLESSVIMRLIGLKNNEGAMQYFGKYLKIGNQAFSAFVTAQLALQKTEDQIAEITANQGIVSLVELVVKKKMEVK